MADQLGAASHGSVATFSALKRQRRADEKPRDCVATGAMNQSRPARQIVGGYFTSTERDTTKLESPGITLPSMRTVACPGEAKVTRRGRLLISSSIVQTVLAASTGTC